MRDVMFYAGMVALAGALVTGLLGFVIFPATRERKRNGKRKPPPPRQGLARALFIIFAAATFVCLFFGMFMPG